MMHDGAVWESPAVLAGTDPLDLAGSGRTAVHRLDLSHFRSWRDARIETGGRSVVLIGANGAGKTNILEAVSFLAPGRGLRRARLVEIDHQPRLAGRDEEDMNGGTAWAISARVETPSGLVAIGTGRDQAGDGSDRRLVRIDGQPIKGQAALAEYLHLVWLTPQMDRLFQDGTAPRRRFLDRLVFGFHADHAARLTRYEQALRERARLLREGGADPAWLSRVEHGMVEDGVAIAASRREVVMRLDAAATAMGGDVFPVPRIAVAGTVETWLDGSPSLAVEDRLRREFATNRRLDAEAGGAVIGPHRSDLAVRHAGKDVAAERCSTGEQKALLVALVLAHARLQAEAKGTAPVLLLDEIAAHLDAARRDALFAAIRDLGAQAWMTGTDAMLFAGMAPAAEIFTVSGDGLTLGEDHRGMR